MIEAFEFHAKSSADELLNAIGVLRTLNSTGARLVPPDAGPASPHERGDVR